MQSLWGDRKTVLAMLVLGLTAALAAPAQAREWLAGDGHVHTCYSHDAWCPGEDLQEETLYSNFGSVEQRFIEAAGKGLDFLVISDHDDVRAWDDPAFGSQGVIGVHAYESSLPGGHAHAVGVSRLHDRGSGSNPDEWAAAANALAGSIRADGGLFQANHPGYRANAPVTGCADLELARWQTTPMHWRYGFSVRPDLVEVWNPTTMMQPGELLWECWLQRGERIPASAGSDSHQGLSAQIGNPTLWVLAQNRSEAAILSGMRAGRTTITRRPPSEGGVRLLLEGPRGAGIGDEVRPGDRLVARVDGLDAPGYVRIRANGRTIVERAPILPGGTVEFAAPAEPGWVRASLLMTETAFAGTDPNCTPGDVTSEYPFAVCSGDLLVAALTSPVWVLADEVKKPRKRALR